MTMIMAKSKILVFNRYYIPAKNAGGPLKSLPALFEALSDYYTVHLVVLDRDVGSKEFFGLSQDKTNWHVVGRVKVRYLKDSEVSFVLLRSIIDELNPSLLYTNSFFDHIFSFRIFRIAKASKIPLLIAPRGELNPGAVAIKFRLKYLYLKFFNLAFANRFYFHATSIQEFESVELNINGAKIFLAQNLSYIPKAFFSLPPRGPVRVCFIARISKVKNLEFALNVIRQVRRPVIFDVYGPVEDLTVMERCREIAIDIVNAKVTFHGAIDTNQVGDTLSAYHLYFLPTKGENFGYGIAEALAAGIPVLISDQTPWDPAPNGAGANYPLIRTDLFVKFIQEFDTSECAVLKNRSLARQYYESFCNVDYWTQKHLEMFNSVERSHR